MTRGSFHASVRRPHPDFITAWLGLGRHNLHLTVFTGIRGARYGIIGSDIPGEHELALGHVRIGIEYMSFAKRSNA